MDGCILVSSDPLAIVVVRRISGFAKSAKVCDFLLGKQNLFVSHRHMAIG